MAHGRRTMSHGKPERQPPVLIVPGVPTKPGSVSETRVKPIVNHHRRPPEMGSALSSIFVSETKQEIQKAATRQGLGLTKRKGEQFGRTRLPNNTPYTFSSTPLATGPANWCTSPPLVTRSRYWHPRLFASFSIIDDYALVCMLRDLCPASPRAFS